MPATREDLAQRLETLGVKFEIVEHPPLFTVEDSKKLRGEIPGAHTKNLFLKDKKDALWLVVTLEDTKIEMKNLHKVIGSARLSFGKPELLMEILGVPPGSVTPFSLINDDKNRVNVVLDEEMMESEILNYHPLTNQATMSLSNGDLLAFVHSCGHEPQIVNVSELNQTESGKP